MSKLRSVSTSFWSDPFIEELSSDEKLLYIYLITNDKTNMLGICEISMARISFDTGIKKETIQKALKRFESLSKVKLVSNFIILCNFLKHQNFNTNMMKSAIDVYNALPNVLKVKGLVVSKDNPSEGFESLSKGLGMVRKVEVEVEYKDEEEDEEEDEKNIPPFEVFKSYALEKKPNASEEAIRLKYEAWKQSDWKCGKSSRKITNWKTTLLNTLPYMKEEVKLNGFDINR